MNVIRKLFYRKKAAIADQPPMRPVYATWMVQRLQQWESRMTNRQKIFSLVAIFLLVAAFFIHLLVTSLRSPTGYYKIGNRTVINPLPAYQQDTGGFEWVIEYNHYLDSLKADTNGIRIYRKMRAERPGLIDTIEMAARLLREQK